MSMRAINLIMSVLMSSCSFFGIQNEEGPKYKVLHREGRFEVREYKPYIVAKTTVVGKFNKSSGKAFRILAGYIFGKNKNSSKISMTTPVEVEKKSTMIAMTSPVVMSQNGDNYSMRFSMPSKYKLEDLPEPLDDRIIFEKVESRVVATHQFSWLSSQEKNDKKAKELNEWLKKYKQYERSAQYSYAGYNPPWTIAFLRRNEVHIKLKLKQ
jgi:hypothetical protein